jgi:hypothetical protein
MMHWATTYPHKVYASVILLDGKLYNWKVGQHAWLCPGEVKICFSDFDKMNRMTVEHTFWEVGNPTEHNQAFDQAKEWLKQWPIHENHVGAKPY